MESLRPYVWLRKQSSQYNAFFTISIPADFRVSGLQGPTDNTTAGTRSYGYAIEAHTGSPACIVESNVGNHSQPSGISILELKVLDITDPSHPINKGVTDTNYDNADDMG